MNFRAGKEKKKTVIFSKGEAGKEGGEGEEEWFEYKYPHFLGGRGIYGRTVEHIFYYYFCPRISHADVVRSLRARHDQKQLRCLKPYIFLSLSTSLPHQRRLASKPEGKEDLVPQSFSGSIQRRFLLRAGEGRGGRGRINKK